MRRSSFAAVAAVLVAGACGIQPTGSVGAGPGARAEWQATTVYYLNGDQPYPAFRPTERARDPEDLAAILADGTTAQERAAGLHNEVPASLRVTVEDGRIVVDAAGTLPEPALVQIACTLQRNGVAGPSAGTLHGPDGAVVHDAGCPVTPTSISLPPCSPSWRSTTNPRHWPSSPSSSTRTIAPGGC
ncbi:hypothetical protein [Haloactinopolyspora alba]|uniref:hypothetical protein n=1 Tax=Haloactinopolyspora alba TaxID=648780 RepID=UPI000D0DC57A|nr:hypothetical protein [Haloactinopolyspora alba]